MLNSRGKGKHNNSNELKMVATPIALGNHNETG